MSVTSTKASAEIHYKCHKNSCLFQLYINSKHFNANLCVLLNMVRCVNGNVNFTHMKKFNNFLINVLAMLHSYIINFYYDFSEENLVKHYV